MKTRSILAGPRNSSAANHTLYSSLLLAALLLPMRAHGQAAQPSLSTFAGGSADSAIYQNQQNSMTDFVLSDGWSGSDTGAVVSLQLVDSYGSATLKASGSAGGGDGYAGRGDASVDAGSTDYLTISSSVQSGKIVARFTASGDITGADSIAGSSGGGSYHLAVSVNDVSWSADGSFDTQTGWSGTPLAQVGSITVTSPVPFGTPFALDQEAALDASGSCNGYTGLGACSGSGSGNLTWRRQGYTVTDDSDNPVNFTMQSNTGWGRGDVIPAGGMYGGFSLTNGAPGRFGTTLQLLDGTASAPTQVVAAFVAPPDASEKVKLVSDAVDLTGTNSDPVVAQMNFNPDPAYANLALFEIGWYQNAKGVWKNAVLGNSGTTMPTFFNRAYNPATDFHLGYYGIDSVNHVAWAVVNHNSRFGVMVSPIAVNSVSHPAAHTIHLNCNGEPGAVNRVEASPNLSPANFLTVASIAADDAGSFQFDDTNAGTHKFYRVAYP